MMEKKFMFIAAICCTALFMLAGCASEPAISGSPKTNENAQKTAAKPPAAPPLSSSSSAASQGDPIDTSKHDAEIEQAEKELKTKPQDADARMALAKAYHARASALTKARQYRSALGDYRRTLKYDPENEDAKEMSTTITGIMKSMGREIPAEGEEPPPLPFKKDEKKPEDNSQKKSY